jgi:fimbrial isopeptide formation D2 family protein
MFMVLAGVLVLPVERAVADGLELGPDGYFSTLSTGELPVASNGWASTRRIVFGKQGVSGTYGGASVSGGHKTLAKGVVASVPDADFGVNQAYSKSATTSVAANEALLWADNVVTSGFAFDTNTPFRNSFDSATGSYKSKLAQVSDAVGMQNYSVFEQGLLSAGKLEGVCTAEQPTGCGSGSYTQQSDSVNAYKVFPLSIGDVNKYVGHTSGYSSDADLACPSNTCANSVSGSWLRSAFWNIDTAAFCVWGDGLPRGYNALSILLGLRPALRLNLDNLLLSADSSNQSQGASGDLRLTFVESGKKLGPWSGSVSGSAGSRMLSLSGSSDLGANLGWKIVDPVSNAVLGSGRTSAGGNMALPESAMSDESKDYDLYVWGQQDGTAADGLTNKATEPVKVTIKDWQVKTPPSYGIELTGTTTGGLKAYKIGDYAESVFDQTGALKSVKLSTPADPVKASVLAAAGAAGGSNVDVDNPMGWVGSQWLGYPTDPPTDDVTSAYSPYAGKLQLFAKALEGAVASLGAPAGSLTGLSGGPETLTVSGPGLYLIVDSSGASLPMIVGSKVFNDAVGGEGDFVDFVDAGVKGKPRLGQAALKTSITDIAKRVVNDPGMDGFDVGSQVEYEITLRVPDLSGFTVIYDLYAFDVVDVAEPGLTLPAAGDVRVFMDVPSADTEVTGRLPSNSITVSGQTLSVTGLRSLFAGNGVTGVKNTVPAGSLMRIRYKAVLNTEHAEYSASGDGGARISPNANTATLTRSKNDGGAEQMAATANAYTFEADVVKVDKDDLSRKLGGAQFEVSRARQGGGSETLEFVKLSDGVYRLAVGGETGSAVVVTKADGTLSLLGVEARELSFKETAAPSGYFRVSDFGVDIRPEWDADATQVTRVTYATSGTNLAYVSQDGRQVMVLDPAWSLANLPYTGGMGILILLIIGGLILAFAIRPYILSKRAERDANLV